jgi:hypothetical protein
MLTLLEVHERTHQGMGGSPQVQATAFVTSAFRVKAVAGSTPIRSHSTRTMMSLLAALIWLAGLSVEPPAPR